MSRERNIDDDEPEYSQSASKRFRPTNHVVEEEDEEDEEEDITLLAGDDGFVQGSIVKITLTNFVTYDYCEIMPGPQMNMIIGPNGTGKSTIVCAIALGLGGSPALLGRARSITEFVKTGADEATISIELKMVETRNVIIQRIFKKEGATSAWRKNGRSTSLKEVLTTVRDLNIQVDNLCQFLPQDRVSEFAELSPSQLLERTQAAAGESDLHDMQTKLMEWRKKEKDLEKAQSSDLDHLKSLQTRNADSERDIMRMQQRADILNNISLLEAQIPLIKYSEAKATVDEIRNQVNREKELVQKVKAELAPTQSLIKECKDDARKMRERVKATKASIASTKEMIPIEQRKIENIKAQIQKLEDAVRDPPSTDYSQFEDAITEINKQISDLHDEGLTMNQRLRETNSQRHANTYSRLQEMDNARHIRLNKLKSRFPDVITAYEFCKNNPDKFIGKIHGPVALVVNVKDVRYASMVEQILGGAGSSHLRYFVCENAQDYRTFTRLIIDEKRLKVNVTWPDVGDDVLRTPTSEAELQAKLKMDHYAISLLEGDPHVIRYLAKESKLNLIPLALKHSREEDIVNSGLFQKFCVGTTYYNVKVSEYGRRSKQTSTTPLRNAEFFGDSVDRVAKATLTDEYRNIEASLQQADVVIREHNLEYERVKRKIEEYKHKKEDLVAQKRDVQREAQDYTKKLHVLKRTKIDLEESKKRPQAMLEKIKELEAKIEETIADEEKLVQDYVIALKKFVDLYENRNVYDLQKIYATEKYTTIDNYCKDQVRVLQVAENDLLSAKRQLQLAQRQAQNYMQECEHAGNNLSEELHVQFQEILRNWRAEGTAETLESLEQRIAIDKDRVAAIRYANPNAMKNYEARKLEIESLEQKIETNKMNISDYKHEITELRGIWEPRVEHLIARISEKFSEAFARIDLNGEVQIDKHEDFDKWGINILVKFRKNEELQLLTGQRQSGGERSVTTVLYLMSLQNLAKSPFRVVDEINQGMDPRNERMIHEQIVLGASKPGTSQYFLITPKLLPNLFYNERMRVLCIYNSEWLPAKIKPLSHYLEHAQTNGVV
ncbi:hypothetical protein MFLAVUS_002728 [Mucor flavus]|uniref:Structural maintenance of chromosomes protein 5 n=1 Tax=Mucor flavus TaxID=439312 RepID=A0ABP9YR31_9FUNG